MFIRLKEILKMLNIGYGLQETVQEKVRFKEKSNQVVWGKYDLVPIQISVLPFQFSKNILYFSDYLLLESDKSKLKSPARFKYATSSQNQRKQEMAALLNQVTLPLKSCSIKFYAEISPIFSRPGKWPTWRIFAFASIEFSVIMHATFQRGIL